MCRTTIEYRADSKCSGCERDIEEAYYSNAGSKPMYLIQPTNGHYYADGSVHCDLCYFGEWNSPDPDNEY